MNESNLNNYCIIYSSLLMCCSYPGEEHPDSLGVLNDFVGTQFALTENAIHEGNWDFSDGVS